MPNKRHLADDAALFDRIEAAARAILNVPSAGHVTHYARSILGMVDELRARDASVGRNPALVTYFNPPKLRGVRRGDVIARHVSAIIYMHDEDGRMYCHGFGREPVMRQRGRDLTLSELSRDSNVKAIANPDGSVLLVHADGLTLWGEY